MASVVFAPRAREDLSSIFDYIANDKPLAAVRWLKSIQDKCGLIASAPEIGERRPEYGPDIRGTVVGRYVIFYRPLPDGVEVVRVVAGERDIRCL
jgi:toxin ParE1/3/4